MLLPFSLCKIWSKSVRMFWLQATELILASLRNKVGRYSTGEVWILQRIKGKAKQQALERIAPWGCKRSQVKETNGQCFQGKAMGCHLQPLQFLHGTTQNSNSHEWGSDWPEAVPREGWPILIDSCTRSVLNTGGVILQLKKITEGENPQLATVRAGLWIYSEDTFSARNAATKSEATVFMFCLV